MPRSAGYYVALLRRVVVFLYNSYISSELFFLITKLREKEKKYVNLVLYMMLLGDKQS